MDLWPEDPLPLTSVRLQPVAVAAFVSSGRRPPQISPEPIPVGRIKAMNALVNVLANRTCRGCRDACIHARAREIVKRWPLRGRRT